MVIYFFLYSWNGHIFLSVFMEWSYISFCIHGMVIYFFLYSWNGHIFLSVFMEWSYISFCIHGMVIYFFLYSWNGHIFLSVFMEWTYILYVCVLQVAAQTGHNVVLVDMSDDILAKSTATIKKSLGRVVKKKFAAEPEASRIDVEKSDN